MVFRTVVFSISMYYVIVLVGMSLGQEASTTLIKQQLTNSTTTSTSIVNTETGAENIQMSNTTTILATNSTQMQSFTTAAAAAGVHESTTIEVLITLNSTVAGSVTNDSVVPVASAAMHNTTMPTSTRLTSAAESTSARQPVKLVSVQSASSRFRSELATVVNFSLLCWVVIIF